MCFACKWKAENRKRKTESGTVLNPGFSSYGMCLPCKCKMRRQLMPHTEYSHTSIDTDMCGRSLYCEYPVPVETT